MTEVRYAWTPKSIRGEDIGSLVSINIDAKENHVGILESFSVTRKHVTYRFQGGFTFSRAQGSVVNSYVMDVFEKGAKID